MELHYATTQKSPLTKVLIACLAMASFVLAQESIPESVTTETIPQEVVSFEPLDADPKIQRYQGEIAPRSPVSERNAQIAKHRVAMIQGVKSNNLIMVRSHRDSLLQEFGSGSWISRDEWLLTELLLGDYHKVLSESSFKKDLFEFHGKWRGYPKFCLEDVHDQSERYFQLLDQGSDLAFHLRRSLQKNWSNHLETMRAIAPELADLLAMAQCKYPAQGPTKQDRQIIADYIFKHPTSPFVPILKYAQSVPSWSGNGFFFGAGPDYRFFNYSKNSAVPNGISGGGSVDMAFPGLRLGFELNVRTYTAHIPLSGAPNEFVTSYNINYYHFRIGRPIPLARNLFAEPWIAAVYNEFSLQNTFNTLGAAGGIHVDLGANPYRDIAGVGLRLTAGWVWDHGNTVQSDFSKHHPYIGLRVLIGFMSENYSGELQNEFR